MNEKGKNMIKVYITNVVRNIKQYKLSKKIIKDISKFKHPQARDEKITSYLLLKCALDIHRIKKVKIKLNKFGKPMLENQEIHFNISHSGGYVVCAVSDSPIGVDIEQTNPNIKSISSRFLTKKELEAYISSSNRKLTQI
jgi:4'-phosphopantetheinyl transferase